MHTLVGKNIIDSKQRSKRQQDRKCRSFKPQVGEYVRALVEPRSNHTENYYNEPCRVVRILSDKNVIIELPDGEQVSKHIGKLEPASPLPPQNEGEEY